MIPDDMSCIPWRFAPSLPHQDCVVSQASMWCLVTPWAPPSRPQLLASKTWVRAGAPSPPHLLTVEGKTTESIDLQWNPLTIRHPEVRLSYSVHYQAVANETSSSLVTNVSSVTTELHS